MRAIRWLRLLRRLFGVWRDPVRPPRPSSDPELAEQRLRASRVFAKSDQSLERRQRLDRLDAAVDSAAEDLRMRRT